MAVAVHLEGENNYDHETLQSQEDAVFMSMALDEAKQVPGVFVPYLDNFKTNDPQLLQPVTFKVTWLCTTGSPPR